MAFKFTRAIYKKIKKFDQQDMKDFLDSVWLQGYNKGNDRENIEFLENIQNLDKVLKDTKGVGPKLYNAIMDNYKDNNNKNLKTE